MIVGLDLSVRSTGLSILESPTNITTTTIKPKGEWWEACYEIYAFLESYIHTAKLVVIESDLAIPSRARSGNQLGKVHGAISVLLGEYQLPVMWVAVSQLRSFAGLKKGQGKASIQLKLNLSDDEADAAVLAIIGACKMGMVTLSPHQMEIVNRIPIHDRFIK